MLQGGADAGARDAKGPQIEPMNDDLKQPRTERYTQVGFDQHHFAVAIGHAEDQNLAQERADLAGREIHHRHHAPPHQAFPGCSAG